MEKTVLVGVITNDQGYEKSMDYLEELEFLTVTAGGFVNKIFTQKLNNPNPKTFIGEGKINQIRDYIKDHDVKTVIFDDELTATQERNISKIFNCKILDRTNLILDIFAQRAKTSYAKTQVELAQCQYLLPRLKGMWTHLERQKGGIGMRGPGETEIETDRRIVRNKISLLKEKIKWEATTGPTGPTRETDVGPMNESIHYHWTGANGKRTGTEAIYLPT